MVEKTKVTAPRTGFFKYVKADYFYVEDVPIDANDQPLDLHDITDNIPAEPADHDEYIELSCTSDHDHTPAVPFTPEEITGRVDHLLIVAQLLCDAGKGRYSDNVPKIVPREPITLRKAAEWLVRDTQDLLARLPRLTFLDDEPPASPLEPSDKEVEEWAAIVAQDRDKNGMQWLADMQQAEDELAQAGKLEPEITASAVLRNAEVLAAHVRAKRGQ